MIGVQVEGGRRTFLPVNAFLYQVALLDKGSFRYLVLSIERDEAISIVAALEHLPLQRPEALNMLTSLLTRLERMLEEAPGFGSLEDGQVCSSSGPSGVR
jgi:bifunctional DNase/RNase